MIRSSSNELEERRVMRLLSDAAAGVAPLQPHEVDILLRGTARGAGRHACARRVLVRRLRHCVAAGAAATVLLGSSLALTSSQPLHGTDEVAPIPSRLASFPEGNALRLLLLSSRGEAGS